MNIEYMASRSPPVRHKHRDLMHGTNPVLRRRDKICVAVRPAQAVAPERSQDSTELARDLQASAFLVVGHIGIAPPRRLIEIPIAGFLHLGDRFIQTHRHVHILSALISHLLRSSIAAR
ncbi:hypothetical protein [Neorhizobium galegae]|uniref:hypothetical protein n=1 Tax=Neorhizobium galegae TaxID=399 RepID=UPI002102ECDC|nr:hypothetical protein [Neorhizobium galegae]MCQ1810730.1 hypothetical protein [Neorhizobium galegae]